jgi:hypothetical protein
MKKRCQPKASFNLAPRLYRMGGGRIPSAKAGDMRLIGSKDGSFGYSTSSTRWVGGGPSPYAFGQRENHPFFPFFRVEGSMNQPIADHSTLSAIRPTISLSRIGGVQMFVVG